MRLLPIGTIALGAFAGLCAAAEEHGNGILEITSRGSIQVRGLTPDSAPRFAAAVGGLGIAASDGIPVLCNALAGLDAEELIDAGALARDLRCALAQSPLGVSLSPKISVAIDGSGGLSLDKVAADVRLGAETGNAGVLRVSVGSDGANAVALSIVPLARGVEAVMRLLDVIAQRGREARARDVLGTEGVAPFHAALAMAGGSCERLLANRERVQNSDVIGMHGLRDGSLACGIGLPFGHAGARLLQRLMEAAKAAGASGVRVAPERALMAIGLSQETAPAFAADAGRLGFIVRTDDPRRNVVACAGAPICVAAHIGARAMAPAIAATAASRLDRSFTIHISGCVKGCAHPSAAALTIVGTAEGGALIANGSARDVPYRVVPTGELPAAIARHLRRRMDDGGHV